MSKSSGDFELLRTLKESDIVVLRDSGVSMEINIFSKAVNWYLSKEALPYWCVLVMDCAIIALCAMIGYYWEFGALGVIGNFWVHLYMLIPYFIIYGIAFRMMRTYSGVIRYSSFDDLLRVGVAMTVGTCLSFIANWLVIDRFSVPHFTWKTIIIVYVLGTLIMIFARVVLKNAVEAYRMRESVRRNAFIFGSLQGAAGVAKSINNTLVPLFRVKGFVAPSGGSDSYHTMRGVKVYHPDGNLVGLMKKEKATVLIVCPMEEDEFLKCQPLIDSIVEAGIKIYMIPTAKEWDGKSDISQNQLQEVEVEDLLPREKIEVDADAIAVFIKGKKVLITGAAGSIGCELVRQVAAFEPAEVVLIDQAETPMHDVRLMMAHSFPDLKAETIVTSITNAEHMEKIFAEHRPDYVFHAAAYKHVPMMEDNPAMAVQNNVRGTRIIADLAVKYGTRKFVMVSTDKAVNPTNVMGCSKRICEIYCQALNKARFAAVESEGGKDADEKEPLTQFVTTRFGNVLGSNGSVIPLFREQIKNGGPVTVTHPDIIRYFMLIPEACKLVLEAGTMGRGGEIFVFDMGKPVKIVDLAKRMIAMSGAKDVKIEFTGLRDGEKLYEEVLSDKESTIPTDNPNIMVARVREYDYDAVVADIERLVSASYSFDDMHIVRIMKEIVPEYKSQSSKYEVLDHELVRTS